MRKKLFGPDKFTMEMTLSEALKDDIVALEAGVYHLLPLKDLSGRQVIFEILHNHTGVGYTSDSLVSCLSHSGYDCKIPLGMKSKASTLASIASSILVYH